VWEPRKQISYQSAACNTLIATKTARRCFVLGQHVPIPDGELHSIAAPTPLLRGILPSFPGPRVCATIEQTELHLLGQVPAGPAVPPPPETMDGYRAEHLPQVGKVGVRRGFTGPRRGGGNMLLVYGVVCLEPDRGPEAKGALTATVRN
jgi:hypothetical protein